MRNYYILLNLRKFIAAFAIMAMMLSASNDATAQSAQYASTMKNYIKSTFNTAFSSIIGQAGTQNLGYGSYPYYSYPYYYSTIALPFNFNYDSVQRTAGSTIYLHNNGAMSFQYTGNYDYGFSCSNGYQTSFPDYINAWGMMYYPYAVGTSGGIYSQVAGTVGSRIWTLEFPNVYCYYSGVPVSVQIKLHELTSAIEFLYSTNNLNMQYGYPGDIGLNGKINGNYTGYDNSYYYFSYRSPFYTPPTQLRFSPVQQTNQQLSVQPKFINFGALAAGSSTSPQCITVMNTGTVGNLTLNSATLSGASDFTFSSIPASNIYAPGGSDQYCVVFTPTQPGTRSAIITFSSNGKDSAVQQVTLIGIGTVAEYSIDSVIRFKKTRTRLGDTLIQWLHITSTGINPFIISNYVLSGIDAGQYSIIYYPTMPMATGTTDSIGLAYVPTIEGKHTATLTLLSNSFANASRTISLQGTGTLPHIIVTPDVVLFDSVKEGQTVCKDITIWNPGSDTLKILSNKFTSNDGDFSYTMLTGQDTLIPPDHTKTINLCFTPKQQGSRQARIILKTNIIATYETPRRDTATLLPIDIRGTGVPFGVFANSVSGLPFLDSAIVGVEVCRTDTLKNDGDADILVTGAVFSVGVFKQAGLPTLPFLLKARTRVTFQLCGTPDKEGLLTGTLNFTGRSSGSNISMNLPLGIYGLKSCATPTPGELFTGVVLPNGSDSSMCVWVHNCGDVAASYTGTVNGVAATDYKITSANPSATVAPGDSVEFCVDYKPMAEGTSNAVLNFTSPTAPNVSVPLNGAAGCATLTSEVATVPNTGANGVTTFTFKITNTGTTPWTPGSATIVGAGKDAFTVISVSPDPIPPGQSGTVTMEFHPSVNSVGNHFIAVVSWPNAGPCENSVVSVNLDGQSVVSSVAASASSEGFILEQSYPNPSQGNTNFNYTTPRETEVRISLVDLTGKLIRTLVSGRVSEGVHSVNFEAKNLTSGTYVYVLESGSTRLVRQFILTK